MEILKLLTISGSRLSKRFVFSDESLKTFRQFRDEGRSSIFVLGHLGNWEWCGSAYSLLNFQQLYAIYHPLSDKYFDGFMYRLRARFGMKLYAMKDTFRCMTENRNEVTITAFVADQTPPRHNAYWTRFLNQDTPVFWGTERIAMKMDLPVIFISVRRVKRGYYEANAEVLIVNSSDTTEGEISEMHVRKLEQSILAQPEIWLWTHRRWKHKRPE